MGLICITEAAIRSGFSAELLQKLVSYAPKHGSSRKLAMTEVDGIPHFDECELKAFIDFLNEPWPLPAGSSRPRIPAYIAADVTAECAYQCALCGNTSHGQLAHIEPVSESLNNSPDNLILLCPNHHVAYDLGYRPAANVELEVIRAAKAVRRASRRRMLRVEANVAECLREVLRMAQSVKAKLDQPVTQQMKQLCQRELRELLNSIPEISRAALESGARDQQSAGLEEKMNELAPTLLNLSSELTAESDEEEIEEAAESMLEAAADFIYLDEVECPHCEGRGFTGRAGDFCAYCGGSCVVTGDEAEDYDPTDIDEVECPHCDGHGMTGRVQDLCSYCEGSCVVTNEEARDYGPDKLDEVKCPHCDGHGITGRVQDLCSYCGGSCVVTNEEARDYDPDKLDEVKCPHCDGHGITGRVQDLCSYCGGRCVVTNEEAEDYSSDEIDEVECPHCNGHGETGRVNDLCAFCGGSCVVTKEEAEDYDPSEIDEVECPHCNGHGETGRVNDLCAFCGGSCAVTKEQSQDYDPDDIDEVECPRCQGRGEIGWGGDLCKLCGGSCCVSRDTARRYRPR